MYKFLKETSDIGKDLHTPSPGKVIFAGVFTIILAFGGLGGWAAIAKISGAIIAPGEVIVDTNRKTVQHLEGGIVKEILVREGSKINKGDVLIRLEAEQVRAGLDMYQGQLDALTVQHARLAAEKDNKNKISWPDLLKDRKHIPKLAELMENEEKIFQTRRMAKDGQIDLIQTQIGQLRLQIDSLKQQTVSVKNIMSSLEEEIKSKNVLLQGRYIEKSQIMELQRNLSSYQLRDGQIQGDILLTMQKISELELRIKDLENKYREESATDLGKVQNAIFDTQEKLRPLEDAANRLDITAPVSGVVVDLRVHSAGGVVSPREPLMDIVPLDNRLIISAKVDVHKITEVWLGQEANIVLSAFKQRVTPRVKGKVIYISADRLTIQSMQGQMPYYLVHIDLDKDSLRDAIENESLLTPGMPAEVYITTKERTVLRYIMEPLVLSINRAFREY
ncbi:MAG: HlyD family type I secretion periplasmic adaptor subunit [Desulfobacterales bacterium]|nr:HlyD family type I secretion periplasmic adaptor subunit [Desulfobacterales bacterium]